MAETTSSRGNTSGRAASRLREVARYLDENAEALVGDLDSIYVLEGGLRFSFELLDDSSIPTVTVSKETIVFDKAAGKT